MKGFTVIELLIILAIIAIGVAATICISGSCSNQEKALAAAKRFAANMENATGNVTCTNTDSDGDGYCSCTVFLKNGNTKDLECGCGWHTEGCKQARLIKINNKSTGFGQ